MYNRVFDTSTLVSAPTTAATSERQAIVSKARSFWMQRLFDLSRRNNLLYFRGLKTGTLNLSNAEPGALHDLLAEQLVPLTRLTPTLDPTQTASRVQEIARRARINMEEKGLQTMFVALGMATWPAPDGGRPALAAVLLVPVAIESRGRESRLISLRRSGDIQINPVLLHVLDTEYACSISSDALLHSLKDTENTSFNYEEVFQQFARQASERIADFKINYLAMLSNFSFQKMAMVNELRERAAELAAHDIIAAIAGDAQAREGVRRVRRSIDSKQLDKTLPDSEFLVLDADSSQQQVIAAVLEGQHGVIQGPPGTGKSQTITNLITALVADGKRVLFVAEKRAALEVVLRRLEKVNLGHLALDLHGADVSRREVISRVAKNLLLVGDVLPVKSQPLHQRFSDLRTRLNEHVQRVHIPRAPAGISVYQLEGRLLGLPDTVQTTVRWTGAALAGLDAKAFEAVRDLLAEAQGFAGLFLHNDASPWTGATVENGDAAQRAVTVVTRISQELQTTSALLAAIIRETQLPMPTSPEHAQQLVALLDEAAAVSVDYQPDLFKQDFDTLLNDFEPARRGVIARLVAQSFNSKYRKARTTVLTLRHTGAASIAQMYAEVDAARALHNRWQQISQGVSQPHTVADRAALRQSLDTLLNDLRVIGTMLRRDDLEQWSFDTISALIQRLYADNYTPYRLVRLHEIEQIIQRYGAGTIITELRRTKPPTVDWPLIFEYAWLRSCLDQVFSTDPSLAAFFGQSHQTVVDEFRTKDEERLKLAAARVRRAHAERVVGVMNANPEQAALVRREAEKKTRHVPLRTLLAQAPDVLTALFPCWMASPLSISQLTGTDRQYFDVVIFDEASQVTPEDAVTALLRAKQVVVAGDKHQLPPTMFFAAGEDENGESDDVAAMEGFESLLDMLSSFLEPWMLQWHYRSQDEALIAFSNRHIYGDRLVTFPGPGGPPAVEHIPVEPTPGQDGQEESVSDEVRRVVGLVLDHASTRPNDTLGVIAMGIKHAQRIEAALDNALRSRPELDDFFSVMRPERFFVKNLERVQGDERDAIILSVGYGKDRSGKLPYRFGPLLTQGGERRLNVAITRARKRMTLVSSFDHFDMDPDRSAARGVELLRLYLQYAASNGKVLGDNNASGIPLNPFEADIFDTLSTHGIPLLPQWGVSGYRIDMVAQHPERPGQICPCNRMRWCNLSFIAYRA